MQQHPQSSTALPGAQPPVGVALPSEGVVRLRTVTAVMGVSASTVWRWIRQGRFPAPIRLGENSVGWEVSALRQHLAKLKQQPEKKGAGAV